MQSYYGQAGVDFALERNWTLGLQAVYNHNNPKDSKAVSITEVYLSGYCPSWTLFFIL